MSTKRKLRIGDWVEVSSLEEILQTLDGEGRLERMPFMPWMFALCGQEFQVFKIAHKTCDNSVYPYRTRRPNRTVHFKTRCDGEAHDGCQAECLKPDMAVKRLLAIKRDEGKVEARYYSSDKQ
jgi:hypothetical protein